MQEQYYRFIIESELMDVNLSGVRHYRYRYKLYHHNTDRKKYPPVRLLFIGQWNYSVAAVKNFIDAVKLYGHNPDYVIVKKKSSLGLEILILSPMGIVLGWNTTLTEHYVNNIVPLDKTMLQEATIHEQ